jgi:hypothetical protein
VPGRRRHVFNRTATRGEERPQAGEADAPPADRSARKPHHTPPLAQAAFGAQTCEGRAPRHRLRLRDARSLRHRDTRDGASSEPARRARARIAAKVALRRASRTPCSSHCCSQKGPGGGRARPSVREWDVPSLRRVVPPTRPMGRHQRCEGHAEGLMDVHPNTSDSAGGDQDVVRGLAGGLLCIRRCGRRLAVTVRRVAQRGAHLHCRWEALG